MGRRLILDLCGSLSIDRVKAAHTLTTFASWQARCLLRCFGFQFRGEKNSPEPLLFIPSCSPKQVDGEQFTVWTHPSSFLWARIIRILLLVRGSVCFCLRHEVVLLGQLNAYRVLLVPHPLPGQALGHQGHLDRRGGLVNIRLALWPRVGKNNPGNPCISKL